DILRTLELEKEQHRPKANQMELFCAEAKTEYESIQNEKEETQVFVMPEVVQELAAVNMNTLTPMDAMNLLYSLQKKAQEVVQSGTD
ncbi:MAG: hypothetical protein IIW51_01945, partial [Peptococcaceae bacterium]|nr:hypothetical protein [Peptococcaceae bacterium]